MPKRIWFVHRIHGYDGAGPVYRMFPDRDEAERYVHRRAGDFKITSACVAMGRPERPVPAG